MSTDKSAGRDSCEDATGRNDERPANDTSHAAGTQAECHHDGTVQFLRALILPCSIFEVRAIGCVERGQSFVAAGYFDDAETAAGWIAKLDAEASPAGIYVTLNPVNPALHARAANKIIPRPKMTTTNADVLRRTRILIDVDAVRPAGVSASDAELAEAEAVASRVAAFLASEGWPDPIRLHSGNGQHLIYGVDLPADDGGLVGRVLAGLAGRFDTAGATIDKSVANPARITKVAGTVTRKGDDYPGSAAAPARPHRRSAILACPETLCTVSVALLERVAVEPPAIAYTERNGQDSGIGHTADEVASWLADRGVTVRGKIAKPTGTALLLDRCPVTGVESTGHSDIAVLVADGGKLAYSNLHARGQGLKWADLRKAIDKPRIDVDLSAIIGHKAETGDVADDDARRRGPAMLTLGELVANHTTLHPPVIDGLLRQGESMNVIASPKIGKSWLTAQLALSVATGRSWLDRFECTQGRVLLCDNELHKPTIANRLRKVADAMRIDIADIGDRVVIWPLRGHLRNLFTIGDVLCRIPRGEFALVLIDAWYRSLPVDTDENDNGAVAGLYNKLDEISEAMGAAFVLIHHATKGRQDNRSVTDVGAGAGSQSRAADTHLILRPHAEPGAIVLDAVTRSFPPVASMVLRREHPLMVADYALDPGRLAAKTPTSSATAREVEPAETKPTPPTPEEFVAAFLGPEPTARELVIYRATTSGRGLTTASAERLLKVAEATGIAHRWTLPTGGVAYANAPPPAAETDPQASPEPASDVRAQKAPVRKAKKPTKHRRKAPIRPQ